MGINQTISESATLAFLFLGGASALGGTLAGVSIAGYQSYTFLKTGLWEPLSASLLLQKGPFASTNLGAWAADPQAWLGAHKIISQTPLSLGVFLLGLALCFIFGWLCRQQTRRHYELYGIYPAQESAQRR